MVFEVIGLHNEHNVKETLQNTLKLEEELMRTYLITADYIHQNEGLQTRLREFAEGNAKRSRQLIDELKNL
ncbi:hypothetical protein GCM10008967_14250 [Bacillus carboniphilus]|uniref:Spore coat protein n=1 Tax=Bacillus carboniphilus TaxID=86663 RepID=A0ABN0W4D2_9BACI